MSRKCIEKHDCDLIIDKKDMCCIECGLLFNCTNVCGNLTEDNICLAEHPDTK